MTGAPISSLAHDMVYDTVRHGPCVLVPLDQLRDIYTRLSKLTAMGQSTREQWDSWSEREQLLRRKVFSVAEFGALYAGQWLPREIYNDLARRLGEEHAAIFAARDEGGIE